jgi:hypothetical protein
MTKTSEWPQRKIDDFFVKTVLLKQSDFLLNEKVKTIPENSD